jgi:hypothetical protein
LSASSPTAGDAATGGPSAGGAGEPVPEARRLTGPNLYDARPGAVLDVAWPADVPAPAVDARARAWGDAFRRVTAHLGWPAPAVLVRRSAGPHGTFVSHYASAPVDQLDAAVDAAELAWAAARPGAAVAPDALDAIARAAAASRVPRLAALLDAADARGLAACWDDEAVTVGAARAAAAGPRRALPDAGAVDWARVGGRAARARHRVERKTTTTRLVARCCARRGHTVGTSSTDGVRVAGAGCRRELGGRRLGRAGRRAPRPPRPARHAAVLETARGGCCGAGSPCAAPTRRA